MRLSRLVTNEGLRRKIAAWCEENSVELKSAKLESDTEQQEEEEEEEEDNNERLCILIHLTEADLQQAPKSVSSTRGMLRRFLVRKSRRGQQ